MRFPSISLTAAALAAITISGSAAIADPGLLHERDLEEVNSFKFERGLAIYRRESEVALLEREGDGELVDLLTRRALSLHQHHQQRHNHVAAIIHNSIQDVRQAAQDAHVASQHARTFDDWTHFCDTSTRLKNIADGLELIGLAHSRAAGSTSVQQALYDQALEHAREANSFAERAREASATAILYSLAKERDHQQ